MAAPRLHDHQVHPVDLKLLRELVRSRGILVRIDQFHLELGGEALVLLEEVGDERIERLWVFLVFPGLVKHNRRDGLLQRFEHRDGLLRQDREFCLRDIDPCIPPT